MYSRKFSGNVPPDYSGITYRNPKNTEQDDREKQDPENEMGEQEVFEEEYRKDGGKGEDRGNNSLFSFSKKNFSMEDLMLSGLLLLLLSDQKGKEGTDGDLLLILGLLLLKK